MANYPQMKNTTQQQELTNSTVNIMLNITANNWR